MAVYSGAMSSFLFKKEASYGTAVAPDRSIGLVTKGFEPNTEAGYMEGEYLSNIELGSLAPSHYAFDGSVEFDAQHFRFMDFVMGGTTTHVETTGDWKHTFVAANTIPSMTVDMSLDATSDYVWRYAGVAVNTATVNFSTDKPVNVSLDMVGKTTDTSDTSATAAVIDDIAIFTPTMTTISVGGGTLTLVKDLTLTIENKIADAKYLASPLRQHATPMHRRYSMTFTMDFQNMTEYERFLGSTSPQNAPATFTTIINSTNGVTLGSGRREFNFQVTNCNYTVAPPKHPADGLTSLELTIVGRSFTAGQCWSVDNITSGNW